MGKLTIAKRLTLGFGIFFLMLLLSILLGLSRLDALNDMLEKVAEKDWRKTVLANEAAGLMNANARETFLLFHSNERQAIKQRIAANVQTITGKLNELETLLYKPEGKAALAELKARRAEYVGAFSQVMKLLDEDRETEAGKLMVSAVVPNLDALLASTNKLIQIQGGILQETAKAGNTI